MSCNEIFVVDQLLKYHPLRNKLKNGRKLIFNLVINRRAHNKLKLNYYEILGIKESASQEEIKAAYYELTKKYHPDVTQRDDDGSRIFVQVAEAYEVLGNANLRQKYDQGILDQRETYRSEAEPIEHEEFLKSRSTRAKIPILARKSAQEFDNWSSALYRKQMTAKMASEEKYATQVAKQKIVKFENKLELFIVFSIIGILTYLAAFQWFVEWKEPAKPPLKKKPT